MGIIEKLMALFRAIGSVQDAQRGILEVNRRVRNRMDPGSMRPGDILAELLGQDEGAARDSVVRMLSAGEAEGLVEWVWERFPDGSVFGPGEWTLRSTGRAAEQGLSVRYSTQGLDAHRSLWIALGDSVLAM